MVFHEKNLPIKAILKGDEMLVMSSSMKNVAGSPRCVPGNLKDVTVVTLPLRTLANDLHVFLFVSNSGERSIGI